MPTANTHDFTDLRQYVGSDGKRLARREHQIIAMLAWGYSDRVIADYLNSSTKAVQTIIRKLSRRYGWTRRQMASYYANEIGLY